MGDPKGEIARESPEIMTITREPGGQFLALITCSLTGLWTKVTMKFPRKLTDLGSLCRSPARRMRMNLTCVRTIAAPIACAVLAGLICPGGLLAGTSGPGTPARTAAVARSTAVHGVVWNADNTPFPNSTVRLRNLQTGRVDAAVTANEEGRFTFDNLDGGSYVIELVDGGGKVIALGQTFRIEPGETVATFIRLGVRQPRLAGLFSNAAAAVISAASSAGVTAIGSQAPPASPQ